MAALIAALQAAAALAPVITNIIPLVQASVGGQPLSSAQGNAVITALTEAATLEPTLAPILPIVQKQFDGVEITAADLALLQETSVAIDALIRAKETSIVGTASAT